jgi:hypothetical protein
MADEARLHDLLDLVEQARSEGDKDTEAKATAAYKRESAPAMPAQDPAQFGGAGGYNPMLSRIGGMSGAVGSQLGMTPENTASPIKNAVGPAETALHYATAGLAMPISGVAGLGQGIWNAVVPKRFEGQQAGDAIREIQEGLTYQPRTGAGAGMARVSGLPMEAYSAGTNKVGEFAAEKTGSPLIGATIKTGLDAGPALLTRGRAEELPIARGGEKYASTKFDVPTTSQLKTASKEAYGAAKESGVVVPSSGYNKALTDMRQMVTEEGIDPTLHPKSTAVMKRLEQANGKDLSLQEAETLRKIALDAEDDVNSIGKPTADARLAGKIVDELDEKIEALSANDQARALWSRASKSQLVDTMVHRAEVKAGAHYTQAGMEHALRQEFKTLALNPRRMRGFTAEQRAAVEKVAKGGPLENTLRTLGKFDPTAGVIPALASIATGGIMPALGFIGRRAATKATSRNVDLAREALVGRGMPQPPLQLPKPAAAMTAPESLPFTSTPGVIPAKAAAMSRGLNFPPAPVANPAALPVTPPRGLTASAPPQPQGGLPFRNYLQTDDGGLSIAPPAPRYPGGLDFNPSALSKGAAEKMSGDLALLGETPAIPARGSMGLLELPRKPRPAKLIQSEIRSLNERIRTEFVNEGASSPKLHLAISELQALQRELEASQANR